MITTRSFRLLQRLKIKRDPALAELWKMYKCKNGIGMFDSFIDVSEKIIEKYAPIQSVKMSNANFKNSKPWLAQALKYFVTPVFKKRDKLDSTNY